MRRALLCAILAVTACTAPAGASMEACDASWRDVDSVIVTPGGHDPEPIQLECIRRIGTYRIRIGFVMPPGPTCHVISEIEVVEGADAVSVTLLLGEDRDPAAGACAPEARQTTTEIDLQAPVGERDLLDGSRSP